MSGERYNVVFSGEIADGHNESVVKASLRELLNIDDNQLNQYF